MRWPARLPRDRVKLAELLINHAWAWRGRGGSERTWLMLMADEKSPRIKSLAPHVAHLVWSGFFDDEDEDAGPV